MGFFHHARPYRARVRMENKPIVGPRNTRPLAGVGEELGRPSTFKYLIDFVWFRVLMLNLNIFAAFVYSNSRVHVTLQRVLPIRTRRPWYVNRDNVHPAGPIERDMALHLPSPRIYCGENLLQRELQLYKFQLKIYFLRAGADCWVIHFIRNIVRTNCWLLHLNG